MSADQRQLVQEHIKLQNEFMEYIRQNGFDYAEYSSPTPGSYYDRYRKRWLEITHAITPALHPEDRKK